MTEQTSVGQRLLRKMASARLTVLNAVAGVQFRVALEVQQGDRGGFHREVDKVEPADGGVGTVEHLLVLHATDEVAALEEYQVGGRSPTAAVGNPKPGVWGKTWDAGDAAIAAGLAAKDDRRLLRVEQEGGVLEGQAERVAARSIYLH